MAHKKGGGTSKNGRDSAGKRLGVKAFAGTEVTAGSIQLGKEALQLSLVKMWVQGKIIHYLL